MAERFCVNQGHDPEINSFPKQFIGKVYTKFHIDRYRTSRDIGWKLYLRIDTLMNRQTSPQHNTPNGHMKMIP